MVGLRNAFSLSKEEVRNATPPGTVTLIGTQESVLDTYDEVLTSHTDTELVRTQTGHHEHEEKHLHLNPEPSPDPADPLNFPLWRKISILLLMGLYAFTANVSSSVISSALPDLVTAFAHLGQGPPTGLVPYSSLTHLIAVNNLMLGASNIWYVRILYDIKVYI